MMYCAIQGHTEPGIPFVYVPDVYLKTVAYQNVTPVLDRNQDIDSNSKGLINRDDEILMRYYLLLGINSINRYFTSLLQDSLTVTIS